MSSLGPLLGDVVERTGGEQLVDGTGPSLHLRGLVLGALDREHRRRPSRRRSPDIASLMRVCASAAVYVALIVSLRVRKASTFACSRCWARVELPLLAEELSVLDLKVSNMVGEAGAAGQRLAGQVLTLHGDRLLCLSLQLGGLLL